MEPESSKSADVPGRRETLRRCVLGLGLGGAMGAALGWGLGGGWWWSGIVKVTAHCARPGFPFVQMVILGLAGMILGLLVAWPRPGRLVVAPGNRHHHGQRDTAPVCTRAGQL